MLKNAMHMEQYIQSKIIIGLCSDRREVFLPFMARTLVMAF